MVKKSAALILLLLLPLSVCIGQAQASLVGDTINGALTYPPNTMNYFSTDSATVSENDPPDNPEFIFYDYPYLEVLTDVDGSRVQIDIINLSTTFVGSNADTPFGFQISLTDLYSDGSYLTGIEVSSYKQPGGSTFSTIDPFVATFSPDSLIIDFVGRQSDNPELLEAWQNDGHLVAEINLETTQVPLPSAVWLLGAGVVGLVGLRRKVRS